MCPQVSLLAKLGETFANSPRGVVSAYLHGSHAEGREHRESDVDVGVLLDYEEYGDRAQRDAARLALATQLGVALGRNDVDIVILNDVPAPLARHVVLDGIRREIARLADNVAELNKTLLALRENDTNVERPESERDRD